MKESGNNKVHIISVVLLIAVLHFCCGQEPVFDPADSFSVFAKKFVDLLEGEYSTLARMCVSYHPNLGPPKPIYELEETENLLCPYEGSIYFRSDEEVKVYFLGTLILNGSSTK